MAGCPHTKEGIIVLQSLGCDVIDQPESLIKDKDKHFKKNCVIHYLPTNREEQKESQQNIPTQDEGMVEEQSMVEEQAINPTNYVLETIGDNFIDDVKSSDPLLLPDVQMEIVAEDSSDTLDIGQKLEVTSEDLPSDDFINNLISSLSSSRNHLGIVTGHRRILSTKNKHLQRKLEFDIKNHLIVDKQKEIVSDSSLNETKLWNNVNSNEKKVFSIFNKLENKKKKADTQSNTNDDLDSSHIQKKKLLRVESKSVNIAKKNIFPSS